MDDITFFMCLITITVLPIICTVIISVKYNTIKIYKYLPSIIILIGSIIYCITVTVVDYNRFIGIVYTGVFMTTTPAILLSLITALAFDFTRLFIKNKR